MSDLKKIMDEYDAAKDDATWEDGHPIFKMAEHIDSLRQRIDVHDQAESYLSDTIERLELEKKELMKCGRNLIMEADQGSTEDWPELGEETDSLRKLIAKLKAREND